MIAGTPKDNPLESFYESPTQDFRTSRIRLGPGDAYLNATRSIEILLIMDGAATIESGQERLSLSRGQSAVVFGGSTYQIRAFSEEVALFRVSLP
jgi:mannose-6-phosphate isomerase